MSRKIYYITEDFNNGYCGGSYMYIHRVRFFNFQKAKKYMQFLKKENTSLSRCFFIGFYFESDKKTDQSNRYRYRCDDQCECVNWGLITEIKNEKY